MLSSYQAGSRSSFTILFIPLGGHPLGPVQRGVNICRMLNLRHRVLGLERAPNFGTTNRLLQSLRLFWYWLLVFTFGIRHRQEIDVIFCENIHALIGGLLGKVIGKPCISDIETEHFLYLKAWERSTLYSWTMRALFALAFRLTQLLVTTCEEDREAYIRQGYAPGRVVTIPLCMDFSVLDAKRHHDRDALRRRLGLEPSAVILIYTGNRTEPPYREGARWICSQLASRIEPLLNKTRILLTGMGKTIPCPYPQVTFTCFVADILEYIRAADICLAPIWRETGVPGKVLEYMALGKPAVITSNLRGFRHLKDGWDAMVAATEEEFVQKLVYLIENPVAATRMGLRARETAQRYHSFEAVGPRLWQVLEEVATTYGRKK